MPMKSAIHSKATLHKYNSLSATHLPKPSHKPKQSSPPPTNNNIGKTSTTNTVNKSPNLLIQLPYLSTPKANPIQPSEATSSPYYLKTTNTQSFTSNQKQQSDIKHIQHLKQNIPYKKYFKNLSLKHLHVSKKSSNFAPDFNNNIMSNPFI